MFTCITKQTGVGRIVTPEEHSQGKQPCRSSSKFKTYWPNFHQVQLKDGKTISKKHNTVQSFETLEVPGYTKVS